MYVWYMALYNHFEVRMQFDEHIKGIWHLIFYSFLIYVPISHVHRCMKWFLRTVMQY